MFPGIMNTGDQAVTDIKIKLLPRSSRTEISGWEGDACKVKVTAPPVDGKANLALISLLSKELGAPKGNIEIISGKGARIKRIRVHGLSREEINQRLGDRNFSE